MPLIYTLVPLILGLIYAKNLTVEAESNVISYPAIVAVIGIGGCLMVIGAFIACVIQGLDQNIPAAIFCCVSSSVLFILFLWLFLQSLNWKLIFEKDILVYKNFLGVTVKINYGEITRITAIYNRHSSQLEKYKIYVQKRCITVECLTKNFGNFERLIKRGLKRANNKIEIEIL